MGLAMARALKARYSDASILVIDKESAVGQHASGRNSGVIHSGLYYKPDSLKAKLCVSGARELRQYCDEFNLPVNPCGKLLVPVTQADETELKALYQRAQQNGVRTELVDQATLNQMEPAANPLAPFALYSPDTAVINPKSVMRHLVRDLQDKQIDLVLGEAVVSVDDERHALATPKQTVSYGTFINCAGTFADKLAHRCGVGRQYTLMPFKGLYYSLSQASELRFNHLVYPVPDMRVPFLGVHVTLSVDGSVYFGPTAIPALGREQYRGVRGIDWRELPVNLTLLGQQYLNNKQGFRTMAHQEALRFLKPRFVAAAQALVPSLTTHDLTSSDKVGIRAQLFNRASRQLEMDFIVERGSHSVHILNAVSPAFTSAFSFARFVLDSYLK
jgi:L-2-hydroxyglutarate oxidase LhgO